MRSGRLTMTRLTLWVLLGGTLCASRSLADEYDFTMVPTVYMIDDTGAITRKLVGQKSKEDLDAALSDFAASVSPEPSA